MQSSLGVILVLTHAFADIIFYDIAFMCAVYSSVRTFFLITATFNDWAQSVLTIVGLLSLR